MTRGRAPGGRTQCCAGVHSRVPPWPGSPGAPPPGRGRLPASRQPTPERGGRWLAGWQARSAQHGRGCDGPCLRAAHGRGPGTLLKQGRAPRPSGAAWEAEAAHEAAAPPCTGHGVRKAGAQRLPGSCPGQLPGAGLATQADQVGGGQLAVHGRLDVQGPAPRQLAGRLIGGLGARIGGAARAAHCRAGSGDE